MRLTRHQRDAVYDALNEILASDLADNDEIDDATLAAMKTAHHKLDQSPARRLNLGEIDAALTAVTYAISQAEERAAYNGKGGPTRALENARHKLNKEVEQCGSTGST